MSRAPAHRAAPRPPSSESLRPVPPKRTRERRAGIESWIAENSSAPWSLKFVARGGDRLQNLLLKFGRGGFPCESLERVEHPPSLIHARRDPRTLAPDGHVNGTGVREVQTGRQLSAEWTFLAAMVEN